MDSAVIGLLSLIVTSATAVGLAWIAYKTTTLHGKVDAVKKQTDGITSALVAKTEIASHAEGMLAGKAEARTEQKEDAIKPPGDGNSGHVRL